MLRLILLGLFMVIMALGAFAVLAMLHWISGPASRPEGGKMPESFRTIAFLVLLVLMFGVTSGVLGAG
ncbi:MAG: hypothetical protein AAFQ64_18690 [Pseudomonadota bacterium]